MLVVIYAKVTNATGVLCSGGKIGGRDEPIPGVGVMVQRKQQLPVIERRHARVDAIKGYELRVGLYASDVSDGMTCLRDASQRAGQTVMQSCSDDALNRLPDIAAPVRLGSRRRRATSIGKGQVVMPRGGGGIDSTVLASSGVQPAGGQSVANTHVMSEPGCAALGAMRPAHPSRQSCSPTRW